MSRPILPPEPSRRRWAGRAALSLWLVYVLAALGVAAVGLPRIFADQSLITIPVFQEVLGDVGVPLPVATAFSFVPPILVSAVVAGIVFLGRRDDPMALTLALATVGLYVYVSASPRVLAITEPGWAWLATVVEVVALAAFIASLYLFPDGRLIPRWTLPVVAFVVGMLVAFPWIGRTGRLIAVRPDAFPPARVAATALLVAVVVVTAGAAQVVRYRRHSDPIARQQARWVLLGFTVVAIPYAGVVLGMALAPGRWIGWLLLAAALLSPVLPTTIAVAILRYRLFDLNRVVSRSVAYALVTALLVTLYSVLVILLREVLPFSGGLPVAASTLAVAAAFDPLRRRVQGSVDRRFNRATTDAAAAFGDFARRLALGADLAVLRRDLRSVVSSSMQPALVSVWLREPRRP